MSAKNEKIGRGGQHKAIEVYLPNLLFLRGTVKGRNIEKIKDTTVATLSLKGSRGGQHKLKRVTIDGMTGWESWLISEQGIVYIYNTTPAHTNFVGRFWPGSGIVMVKKDRTQYPAEGWTIPMAMRFTYLKIQEPLE